MALTVQKDKGRKKIFTKVKSLAYLLVVEVKQIRKALYLDVLAQAGRCTTFDDSAGVEQLLKCQRHLKLKLRATAGLVSLFPIQACRTLVKAP